MFIFILLTGITNGIGDFLIKMSSGKISPLIGTILISAASGLTALVYLIFTNGFKQQQITKEGALFATASGMILGISTLLFFAVLGKIDISRASPIIKPMVVMTSVLLGAFILREKLTLIRMVGIAMSICSIYLLTR